MTCIVVLKLIDKFQINPKIDKIKVSKFASTIIGTSANLKYNDVISVEDILYGLMLPSGNDAAQCLAEYFGKKIFRQRVESKRSRITASQQSQTQKRDFAQYFVSEMNTQSKFLELKQTHFANPHGLINKFNTSTAHDIAKLTAIALAMPKFAQIVITKDHCCQIHDKNLNVIRELHWKNTNKLLSHGFYGVKTGVTDKAGPCLSAAYMNKEEKINLIIVILNAKNLNDRFKQVINIVKWCLRLKGFNKAFLKNLFNQSI